MIVVENMSVEAGSFRLQDLSFQVPEGAHAALMGRTGCGKTTLLEAIIGLRRISAGRLMIAGKELTHAKPALRGVGYVPQDLALFSTMTVQDHLGFALRIRGHAKQDIETRVKELATLLGIEALLARYPQGLSGGEKQRVALGRALSAAPPVLLLDEPLSALDEDTHIDMCLLLKRVRKETGVTILHVTHSTAEAQRLGSVLFRLCEGRLSEEKLAQPETPQGIRQP